MLLWNLQYNTKFILYPKQIGFRKIKNGIKHGIIQNNSNFRYTCVYISFSENIPGYIGYIS
jgi:hypothetical protein